MSRLDNGLIPPHTECPFRARCRLYCYHTGINHYTAYSCAAARAFDIEERPRQPYTIFTRRK